MCVGRAERSRQNIVFETVFSSDEKVDFVMKAKAEGYFIRFFYFCTNSPEININRVIKRYLNGSTKFRYQRLYSGTTNR